MSDKARLIQVGDPAVAAEILRRQEDIDVPRVINGWVEAAQLRKYLAGSANNTLPGSK